LAGGAAACVMGEVDGRLVEGDARFLGIADN
jgi:hypothetical protein